MKCDYDAKTRIPSYIDHSCSNLAVVFYGPVPPRSLSDPRFLSKRRGYTARSHEIASHKLTESNIPVISENEYIVGKIMES